MPYNKAVQSVLSSTKDRSVALVNYHFNVDLIFSRLRERHISKKSLGFKICPILRIRRPLSALPRLWEEVYNCKG